MGSYEAAVSFMNSNIATRRDP